MVRIARVVSPSRMLCRQEPGGSDHKRKVKIPKIKYDVPRIHKLYCLMLMVDMISKLIYSIEHI